MTVTTSTPRVSQAALDTRTRLLTERWRLALGREVVDVLGFPVDPEQMRELARRGWTQRMVETFAAFVHEARTRDTLLARLQSHNLHNVAFEARKVVLNWADRGRVTDEAALAMLPVLGWMTDEQALEALTDAAWAGWDDAVSIWLHEAGGTEAQRGGVVDALGKRAPLAFVAGFGAVEAARGLRAGRLDETGLRTLVGLRGFRLLEE